MDQKTPGLTEVIGVAKEDMLVRSVMSDLQDVHDFCGDARYAAEQLEGSLQRFLAHVDALPPPEYPWPSAR